MNDEHQRAAMELHPDALVVVGVDGTVRAANTLACRLVRRASGDVIGARVSDVLPLEEPGGADWWSCSALPAADPELRALMLVLYAWYLIIQFAAATEATQVGRSAVELVLGSGAVADPHRARPPVAGQVVPGRLGEVAAAVDSPRVAGSVHASYLASAADSDPPERAVGSDHLDLCFENLTCQGELGGGVGLC